MATTIARDIASQLQLIEAATKAGRALQVNKDGSISYASLSTMAGRRIAEIGKSDAEKLDLNRQVVESLKQAMADAVRGDAGLGGARHAQLLATVQQINESSGLGVLVVERYRQALAEFGVGPRSGSARQPSSTGELQGHGASMASSGAAPEGGAEAVGQAAAASGAAPPLRDDQSFRPLHDVRNALVAHHESRRAFESLGVAGRPALALFEDHRILGDRLKVSADPQERADQGAKLLSNLKKLERRLDDAVARGVLTPAQNDTVAQLINRIEGEKALVGAVMANRLDLGSAQATWSQALSLRRLGIDLSAGLLHDRPLDLASVAPLGSGAMNTVYKVADDQGRSFVYKPGLNYQQSLGAHVTMMAQMHGAEFNAGDGKDMEGVDLRFEARNVVAARLDALLGTSVMMGARIAEIPVEKFLFKDLNLRDEDLSLRGDLHSDHGLLMDSVQGSTGGALRGTAVLDAVLGSRELKRDLSALVLVDAVLGSFDRHPSNYLIDIDNGQYRGLKGIDNDFSLFATDLDAGSFRVLSDAERHLLAGDIPESLKEANRSGIAAVRNSMRSLDWFLTEAMGKPGDWHPNPGLDADERLRLQAAVQAFDARKKELADQGLYGAKLAGHPAMKQAWETFAADARQAGIPAAHPFWKFVESGTTIVEAYTSLHLRKSALEQELADEGINVKASSPQTTTHNVGLPGLADKALADRIRQPGFEAELVQAIRPLLTDREVEATVARLRTVQQHLDKLEGQGSLVADWSSDHRNARGQSIDDLVGQSGHSYWAILNEWHQSELAKRHGQFRTPS